jgi:hypothetical protein
MSQAANRGQPSGADAGQVIIGAILTSTDARRETPRSECDASRTLDSGQSQELAGQDIGKHNREGEDDAEEQRAHKRGAEDEHYPWNTLEQIQGDSLSVNLKLTRRLVSKYTADLKGAKWSLNRLRHLPRLTDSEWTNVLSGRAVNLDNVFSGSMSTRTDDRSFERLGAIELWYRVTKPSKTVQSSGDWVIAWSYASKAIQFAFPHRARELITYQEYIMSHFAAVLPQHHGMVIELDKAIRKLVGETNDVELTDTNRFRSLEISYLHAIGVGASSTPNSRTKGKAGQKSGEICRQFNNDACR